MDDAGGNGRYPVVAIGRVHSVLVDRTGAPKQGDEGAPEARLEVFPAYTPALEGVTAGSDVIVLTWLHEADRTVLRVHPRGDRRRPLAGVFATRSPARPNPIGLHRVHVLDIDAAGWLRVAPLEAIDGTPIVDIKPVLDRSRDE